MGKHRVKNIVHRTKLHTTKEEREFIINLKNLHHSFFVGYYLCVLDSDNIASDRLTHSSKPPMFWVSMFIIHFSVDTLISIFSIFSIFFELFLLIIL